RYALAEDGQLARIGAITTPPGSGPRHAAFTADGHLLVVGELDGRLQLHRRTPDAFEPAGVLPVGGNPAAIRTHPPGDLVAVSVRESSEVVLVRVADDAPVEVARFAAGGRTPRDLLFV